VSKLADSFDREVVAADWLAAVADAMSIVFVPFSDP
jgi:hypothetical protein